MRIHTSVITVRRREDKNGIKQTLAKANRASWISSLTSSPTGMFSIWSTNFTILFSVSWLPWAFSKARRLIRASSCQSDRDEARSAVACVIS